MRSHLQPSGSQLVPDPEQVTGKEKLRRVRDLLMIGMMALQGLRTIEVARATVEDLTEKGEHLTLLVRGKTKDRIAYLRPDTAERLREYLGACGEVGPDDLGTPLFTNVAKHPRRLGPSQVRLRTSQYLRLAGLKGRGVSDHALRHTAATLGYLHTGDLRAVQEFLGHGDPRMTSRYAHVVDMAKRNPGIVHPGEGGVRPKYKKVAYTKVVYGLSCQTPGYYRGAPAFNGIAIMPARTGSVTMSRSPSARRSSLTPH